MSKISATIVADSVNQQGDRLTSLLITFPRIILSELLTHRMLSKNTSSSRAIPFNKMVESVETNPFIPIAWQRAHSGMQGTEYITNKEQLEALKKIWLYSRDEAIRSAKAISSGTFELDLGVKYNYGFKATKQLANRLLEPFMWTTMLITGSKEGWNNFFSLRCPKYVFHNLNGDNKEYHFKSKKDVISKFGESEWVEDGFDKPLKDFTSLDWLKVNYGQAEIHIMDLAEKIYDAVNESFHTQILPTMWHVPFRKKINELYPEVENDSEDIVKISVSMAARASYTVVGTEKILTKEEHISLHDRLLTQDPPHSSPMEHCARAMNSKEYYSHLKGEGNPEHEDYKGFGWCRNFKGFIPYRHIIETEKYGNI